MSNVINLRPARNVRVIDHEYMRQFTNEELSYKIWKCLDLAEPVLISNEPVDDDERNDAEFAIIEAGIAADVLARRLTGRDPKELSEELWQQFLKQCEQPRGDGQ